MPTLLLIDEYQSIADGLRRWLPGEFVLHHACNREQMLDALSTQKFDLAICDMFFGEGEHGLRLMQELQRYQLSFVVFAGKPAYPLLRTAMQLGARGFVDKRASFRDLEEVLRKVLAGGVCFEGSLLQKMVQDPVKKLPRNITRGERKVIDQLFNRQLETMDAIAKVTHLSSGTVANRITEASHKLQVSGKRALLEKLQALGYYPEIDPQYAEFMCLDQLF